MYQFVSSNNPAAEQFVNMVSQSIGISFTSVTIILVAVIIWSAVWKLLGLWKSARNGSIIWFIVLAITNTIGILPILYIYVFSKMGKSKRTVKKVSKKKSKKKKK